MHGLINRSIQSFVTETYGDAAWRAVAARAGVGPDGFEAMLTYDDSVTDALLDAASAHLDKPAEALLEDLGTFLVSNSKFEPLRRLLRFGGETFADFLASLDELHGRARLAVPDLDVPEIELDAAGAGTFRLRCRWGRPGACHVMMGVLRAMADDFGALVLLDYIEGDRPGDGMVSIDLLDSRFAAGRSFSLARLER